MVVLPRWDWKNTQDNRYRLARTGPLLSGRLLCLYQFLPLRNLYEKVIGKNSESNASLILMQLVTILKGPRALCELGVIGLGTLGINCFRLGSKL